MMEMAKLPALGYTTLARGARRALPRHAGAAAAAESGRHVRGRRRRSRCRTSSRWCCRSSAEDHAGHQRDRAQQAPAGGRPSAARPKPDVVVTVGKGASALTVTDASGRVIFYAPVTTGSEHDPLPIGEWKVNGVQFNPTFRYNPDLFWDADPSHTKATIPRRTQQPGRPRLDRYLEGALRPPRHAGAVERSAAPSRTAACG